MPIADDYGAVRRALDALRAPGERRVAPVAEQPVAGIVEDAGGEWRCEKCGATTSLEVERTWVRGCCGATAASWSERRNWADPHAI